MAKHIGCDLKTLADELSNYNNFANNAAVSKIDKFGKKVFPVEFVLTEPFYVATITPAIHYTMGGLKIDKQVIIILTIIFLKIVFLGICV